MKKLLLLISAALLVSCSQNKPKYTINGTLPSKQYDGNKVYLVPAEGSNPSNVDSAVIKDGQFVFTGDTERVSIIRLKPILRMKIQELLVVTEKGLITAKLDSNSIGGGTLQNGLLQNWKDLAMKSNRDFAMMQIGKNKGVKGNELALLEKKSFASRSALLVFTKQIIQEHKGSTLSKFLSNMTGEK